MTHQVYELIIYSTEQGKEPFSEWLDNLEFVDATRVDTRLERIVKGNFGEYKHLFEDVYELKFKNHSGFRIYYGLDGNKIILLLNAGNKSTQRRDIQKAKIYWNKYKERKNEKI